MTISSICLPSAFSRCVLERLRLLDQRRGILVGQQRDAELGGILGLGEGRDRCERDGGAVPWRKRRRLIMRRFLS